MHTVQVGKFSFGFRLFLFILQAVSLTQALAAAAPVDWKAQNRFASLLRAGMHVSAALYLHLQSEARCLFSLCHVLSRCELLHVRASVPGSSADRCSREG